MSDFNYVTHLSESLFLKNEVVISNCTLTQEAILEYQNAFITQNLIKIYKHHFALNSLFFLFFFFLFCSFLSLSLSLSSCNMNTTVQVRWDKFLGFAWRFGLLAFLNSVD
jgi:hypothetical protein